MNTASATFWFCSYRTGEGVPPKFACRLILDPFPTSALSNLLYYPVLTPGEYLKEQKFSILLSRCNKYFCNRQHKKQGPKLLNQKKNAVNESDTEQW